MALRHRLWPSLVYAAGLLAVYVGERIVPPGSTARAVSVIGLAAVLAAVGLRLYDERRSADSHRTVERMLLLLYALGAGALLLHFASTELPAWLGLKALEAQHARLAGVLSVLWPALLLTGTLPVVFVELSLSTMSRAVVLDTRRVRAAMLSGLGLVFALVFCFAAAYVASERNIKADLSYFRTARAGDATRKLVRALDKPIQAYLFYPPANDVAEEVAGYFADLARESSMLTVTRLDHALEPARAQELGASGNGVIVLARDKRHEVIPVPVKLESARSKLRVLDQEVHRKLLLVSRGARVAYFVQGHEERTFNSIGETDRRAPIHFLRELFTELGYDTKELGMAQGLGTDVPTDAGLVLLIGPRRPLLPAETASLLRYVDHKGRLLLALDPSGPDFSELLAGLSLRYTPTTLANDRIFWVRAHAKSDRTGIATGSYSLHASVSTLNQYGMRMPVVMLGAGYLDRAEKLADGRTVDFAIHAEGNTWNDLDGNFEFDSAKEKRKAYELAAAVGKRAATPEEESRVFVLANSDALADELIINRGNTILAADVIHWLSGDEKIGGVVNNEEDVPVQHTRRQDVVWFYGTVFAVPMVVLAVGLTTTRRRRKRKQQAKASAPSSATPPATGVSP